MLCCRPKPAEVLAASGSRLFHPFSAALPGDTAEPGSEPHVEVPCLLLGPLCLGVTRHRSQSLQRDNKSQQTLLGQLRLVGVPGIYKSFHRVGGKGSESGGIGIHRCVENVFEDVLAPSGKIPGPDR